MVVIIVVVIKLLVVVTLIAWLIVVVAVKSVVTVALVAPTKLIKLKHFKNSFRQSHITDKNTQEKQKQQKENTNKQEHQHQQNGLRSARQSKDTSALSLVPPYLELIVTGTATWSLKAVGRYW